MDMIKESAQKIHTEVFRKLVRFFVISISKINMNDWQNSVDNSVILLFLYFHTCLQKFECICEDNNEK